MTAGFRWVCRIRWPRSRRSLVRHPRWARRRCRVTGPPARDRGRRRRRRPRATAVGLLGVFSHGSPAAGGRCATPAGLRRDWIRIWHRRLCGPVFVGSRRSGSSLQPRSAVVGAVARAAPGSHPDPAAPGQGMVPSVGGLPEGIEAWWRWLHRVGGDLLGDLTGVSDAAWRSRSSQRPAALAVLCGSL